MTYHNLISDDCKVLYNKTAELLFDGISIADACRITECSSGRFHRWVVYNRIDAYQFYLKFKEYAKEKRKSEKEQFIAEMKAKFNEKPA